MIAIKSKWGLSTKIVGALNTGDTFLKVPSDVLSAWIPASGTQYYATLRSGGQIEHVLVKGYIAGRGLLVARAQDGTTVGNFPAGSCISVEWNPQQLLDFLDNKPDVKPKIQAGVHCIGCNTCLTIEADGTISAINGAESC